MLAGIAALFQQDIKRVLAYSTMSQIGYMMLALGAGAWGAGIFHLMTHAFFKALLFLTAGSIIYALHHEQNLFRMGGLLKKLPFDSAMLGIGLICLMALPGTSGFFSKETIIAALWSSDTAGPIVWWLAILGALLTSIYSCRMFFLACLGSRRSSVTLSTTQLPLYRIPLIILAVLSLLGGLLMVDLTSVFSAALKTNVQDPAWLHVVAIAIPFIGILFAWFYYRIERGHDMALIERLECKLSDSQRYGFFASGLGFDWLYNRLFVRPYLYISHINRQDIVDQIAMLLAWYIGLFRDVWRVGQNGKYTLVRVGICNGAYFINSRVANMIISYYLLAIVFLGLLSWACEIGKAARLK